MSTRAMLTPYAAEFPVTNFCELLTLATTRRQVLAFDASTDETCYWSIVAPQGWTGPFILVIKYVMASAITGVLGFDVAIESITPGDPINLLTTNSFDAVNSGSETVPGSAGNLGELSITLTNNDSSNAGDEFRISLTRNTGVASNAAGDCYVLHSELRDAA